MHGNLCMILAIMQATADGGGGQQIAALLRTFQDTLRYSTWLHHMNIFSKQETKNYPQFLEFCLFLWQLPCEMLQRWFELLFLKFNFAIFLVGNRSSEVLADRVFFQHFVALGANFEGHNWKHDLVRLCFMLYTPSFGNSWKKWKFCNWVVRRRRPLWCQWRPLCGFGNFGKQF